jgi:acetyl-CoA carboxylase biotin carboxyl carrier protein
VDFLKDIGEFMRRESLDEVEIEDGELVVILRASRHAPAREKTDEGPADIVLSPWSGVLHFSAGPGQLPYAAPGQRKEEGAVLFCVEAMKQINEVRASCELEVRELLLADGRAVRQGEAVMRISEVGEA